MYTCAHMYCSIHVIIIILYCSIHVIIIIFFCTFLSSFCLYLVPHYAMGFTFSSLYYLLVYNVLS